MGAVTCEAVVDLLKKYAKGLGERNVLVEKKRLRDFVKEAMDGVTDHSRNAFAALQVNGIQFGLGGFETGIVFTDEGVYFKRWGGGSIACTHRLGDYFIPDYFMTWSQFAEKANVRALTKEEKRARATEYNKMEGEYVQVVDEKTVFVDLSNTNIEAQAFVDFLRELQQVARKGNGVHEKVYPAEVKEKKGGCAKWFWMAALVFLAVGVAKKFGLL